MISRQLKATYYAIMRLPMLLNGRLYKALRAPTHGLVRVQLGPGQKNYLPDWINVDANIVTAKCDVWANLVDPLPFHDETVDVFYSHHVVEHLPDQYLVSHFKDLHRCLKPGGMFRVGGPHGHNALQKYLQNDLAWFGNFNHHHESIGGNLVNFIFCRNEHLTLLTPSYLEEITQAAGFKRLAICEPTRTTTNPALIDQRVLNMEYESTFDTPHTLIIEGYKPGV
jgi:SAM-dependent methyltransferase